MQNWLWKKVGRFVACKKTPSTLSPSSRISRIHMPGDAAKGMTPGHGSVSYPGMGTVSCSAAANFCESRLLGWHYSLIHQPKWWIYALLVNFLMNWPTWYQKKIYYTKSFWFPTYKTLSGKNQKKASRHFCTISAELNFWKSSLTFDEWSLQSTGFFKFRQNGHTFR